MATHRRVSASEAHELMAQGYAYLDVRSEAEFGLGHVRSAFNVPLQHDTQRGREDNPDFLRVVRSTFAPDGGLIVGCRTGTRSLRACALLQEAGYVSVVEQRSGYEGSRDAFGRATERGWQAEGLPCDLEPASGHDYAALKRKADANAKK